MDGLTLWGRIRKTGAGFFKAVGETSELVYLILLSFYVLLFLALKLSWSDTAEPIAAMVRYFCLSMIMWGAALYLFFAIARWLDLWKKTIPLVLIGGALLAAVFFFTRWMSTNAYTVVMDFYFCLMAYGKSYKKMLCCILCVVLAALLLAGVFMPIGITWDMQKPENISPGHSLGIVYPNTWGYIAFLGMMIAWYLFMRQRPWLTFPVFWGVAAFMYYYISCRTIALLAVVFPIPALVVDLLENRAVKRSNGYKTKVGVLGWVVTAMPFIAFAFMLYVSYQYTWVHRHFYYTALHTMAMRFVQGGLYFYTYGLPIFGNPYRSNQHTYVNVNGSFEEVGILDSSFAAYIIMRGLFWLTYTLTWLSAAIHKAIRNKDYAIPFLCGIILVFAMMERPGLDLWYNFILLYPLAAVVSRVQDPPAPEPEPVDAPDGAEAVEAPEAAEAVEEAPEALPETDEAVPPQESEV